MWTWTDLRGYVGFDREFFTDTADRARGVGAVALVEAAERVIEYIDGNHAGAMFIAHECQVRDRLKLFRTFEDFKREQHYITDAPHGVGWRR